MNAWIDSSQPNPAREGTPLFKDLRILTIDDDPDIRLVIVTILSKIAGQVLEAEHPREGLRLAIIYKPHLILLDNDMPDLKGVELLAQMRSFKALAQTPVLMLTGDNLEKSVLTALQNKAQGYLLKPFSPQQLRDAVVKILMGL